MKNKKPKPLDSNKKRVEKIKLYWRVLLDELKDGLHQEWRETGDIPKHIKNRNFKDVIAQITDIFRMIFITILWILPGGAILSGFIVKLFKGIRPSAFREKDKELKDE